MSLFLGKLSGSADDEAPVFNALRSYGELIDWSWRNSFAFVVFADQNDAERAMKALLGKKVGKSTLHICWSRKSGQWNGDKVQLPSDRQRRPREERKKREDARRPRDTRRRSRSRSAPRVRSRSRSRSARRAASSASASSSNSATDQ
jgi:hypothetical protein